MSPLAKELFIKLSKEKDTKLIAEVIDFYEYLKHKKIETLNKIWSEIEEEEPSEDEVEIINKYLHEDNNEFVQLDSLIKELGLDE